MILSMSRHARSRDQDRAQPADERERSSSPFAPREFLKRGDEKEPPSTQATAGHLFDAYVQQRRAVLKAESRSDAAPVRQNKTGLPDGLKAGIESFSGISMDDVKVHYNSPQPAKVQALAYTQGSEIHVAPGQEKHLPHEAWHAVQQKQGRVRATGQVAGVALNDDPGLEREADVMGDKASRMKPEPRD